MRSSRLALAGLAAVVVAPIAVAVVASSDSEDRPWLVAAFALAAGLSLAAASLLVLRRRPAGEREREFLNAIANEAPSLLCLIDEHGVVASVASNRAFARTLGYDASETGGHVFWERYVAPDEADDVAHTIRRAIAGETVEAHDSTWITKTGEHLSVSWTCTPLPAVDERRLLLVSGVDVTERKHRELELQRERDATTTVLQTISSVVTVLDRGFCIRDRDVDNPLAAVNRAFRETLHWRDHDLVGRNFLELIADDDGRAHHALTVAAAGAPSPLVESDWLRADGERVTLEWSAAPVADVTGRTDGLVLVSGVDVTERKVKEAELQRNEEELRASRARIVAAGDDARRRLERDLHDGAQQRLVALSVSLRLAESKLAHDPDRAIAILAAAREELAHALAELRELARGIHPAVLSDRGLVPALEALVNRAPLTVALETSVSRLPPGIEAAAYFVVSESLVNVSKYAQATAARVGVHLRDGALTVTVEDNGVGGADPARGTGLRGLADRVSALDGTFVVTSPPGGGTCVRADVPVGTAAPAA